MNNINYKLGLKKKVATIKNNSSVIVSNLEYGTWLKIDEEVYGFILDCLEKDKSISQILELCEDEVTVKYIKDLLKKMYENEITYIKGKDNDDVKLKEVSINLTNDCNLRCLHCSSACGEGEKFYLSFEQIDKVVRWSEENKIERVVLTGGEIFLRNDMEEIIHHIKKVFSGEIVIMTNGTLISDHMVKVIAETVSSVNISLDGFDEKTVSQVRGKGVYDKVLNVIGKLQENGMKKISLSMVITELTKNNIDDFENLCKKLSVKPLIRVLNLVGRAYKNMDKLEIKDEKEIADSEKLKNLRCKAICKAGHTTISVQANGNIYPCEVLGVKKYILGNISNMDNIKDISINPVVDSIEGCKDCKLRYFCSNGCVGMDYNLYNNELLRTERCQKIKEQYSDLIWS